MLYEVYEEVITIILLDLANSIINKVRNRKLDKMLKKF